MSENGVNSLACERHIRYSSNGDFGIEPHYDSRLIFSTVSMDSWESNEPSTIFVLDIINVRDE